MAPGSRWRTSVLNYYPVKGGLELRSLWEIKQRRHLNWALGAKERLERDQRVALVCTDLRQDRVEKRSQKLAEN